MKGMKKNNYAAFCGFISDAILFGISSSTSQDFMVRGENFSCPQAKF